MKVQSPAFVSKHPAWTCVLITCAGFALGLLLTFNGMINWDDWEHLRQSRWLLSTYGLISPGEDPSIIMKWYGPLWETVMGLFSFVLFGWTKDPLWIRHALTFALFPLTLWGVYRLLRRAGYACESAGLAVAALFGLIRFGGHSLVNSKDFPFACAYLIASLALWEFFRVLARAPRWHPRRLALIGTISVIPYLLRPPVALHFAVGLGYLCVILVQRRDLSIKERLLALCSFLGAAIAFVWAFYPAIRIFGLGMWMQSFALFSQFPWIGIVRLYGQVFRSDQLPIWYGPSWFPLMMHPLLLVALCVGAWGLFKHKGPTSAAPLKNPLWGPDLSLPAWLGFLAALSWAAILVRAPVLYDEERHLLFLYPLTALWLALGLDFLVAKKKKYLSWALVVCSLVSYAQWGRFSYVYKSPLMGDISAQRFMGDYWGLCVSDAMTRLKGLIPEDSEIAIVGPTATGPVQLERLREALFYKRPGFEKFQMKDINEAHRPVAVIALNRPLITGLLMQEELKKAFAANAARPIDAVMMPPGEAACQTAYFPKPGYDERHE